MNKRKDNLLQMTKDSHREEIIEMVGQIEDEKFLRRIYISLRDYLNEKE